MRFPDLPLGAHFRWRDGDYIKTGPVTARSVADSSQRMIPRSATVTALDGAATTDRSEASRVAPDQLEAALSECIDAVNHACADLDETARARLAKALIAARARLLGRLGLAPAASDDPHLSD
jgi:hypothetical protein